VIWDFPIFSDFFHFFSFFFKCFQKKFFKYGNEGYIQLKNLDMEGTPK